MPLLADSFHNLWLARIFMSAAEQETLLHTLSSSDQGAHSQRSQVDFRGLRVAKLTVSFCCFPAFEFQYCG